MTDELEGRPQAGLNVDAVEFVPALPPPQQPPPVTSLDLVSEVTYILSHDPASFDDQMPALIEALNISEVEEEELAYIVDIIFKESVVNANFRYTGARMCNSLQQSFSPKSGKFLEKLLSRCQAEHDNIIRYSKEVSIEDVTGFSLLLAELFRNITKNGKTLELLLKPIQKLLHVLLTLEPSSYLKCVMQLLKLCGYLLDETEARLSPAGCTPIMDGIIDHIKEIMVAEEIDSSMIAMMLSVIELRARNWDYEQQEAEKAQEIQKHQTATPIPAEATPIPAEATSQYEEQAQAVLYDGQGNALSPEEYATLQEEIDQQLFMDEVEFEHYQNSPNDVLNDRMAAAYDQFLQNLPS